MKSEKHICAKRKFHIEQWHIVAGFLVFYDIVAVSTSYFAALWIRFDGIFAGIPEEYFDAYVDFSPFYALICVAVFWFIRMYHSVWKYASFNEMVRTAFGSCITAVLHTVIITVFYERMPMSYYLIGGCVQLLLLVAARFSYRFLLLEVNKIKAVRENQFVNRVMIIGAGNAGQQILRSIEKEIHHEDKVVCFIDDNSNKHGRYIEGVIVAGGRTDIIYNVEKYKVNKIYIAIPSASKAEIRDIINICSATTCEVKHLPDLYQFVESGITVSQMKDISVEDLLGRDAINVDMDEIYQLIRGKTILVTGGGGSIGSELCRQVAAQKPARLVIFDIYENNAYSVQQEIKEKYPDLKLDVLIGSVRDSRRLDEVFSTYKPDIVYHAAAHKHVPLMEDSPCESIKNNVIGTYKTAYAAMKYDCSRFVLISTDKAVNPTNIMGASKQLCEMIITAFNKQIKEQKCMNIPRMFTHYEDVQTSADAENNVLENVKTEFVAVRFGNVLGSNGSVVPIFKQQIANGGPVKVTHPDIIRYFMTIPEAVSLVLLAGANAQGGEIFVLDMGSPVKIDTLARNLIKLSGLVPDVDIKIEYTGLRPGEKLYEEMLMEEEGLQKTQNELVFIGKPIPFDAEVFQKQLEELMLAAYENRNDIKQQVRQMVPTYNPDNGNK